MRTSKRIILGHASLLVLVLALSGCGQRGDRAASGPQAGTPQISDRGPGMRRQALSSLQMPVSRTFELTHVDPKHFAEALGNDPVRIFEFVRDQIAFEAYTGYLRGPRGTLLAMAGNSVDRASLLGAILQHAGQRIRYARGTLPDQDARDLVTSMWAERQTAPTPQAPETPASVKTALETLRTGVQRDYTILRDQLKGARTATPNLSRTLATLIGEARSHYWVQWFKDGRWTDLDPSFTDAAPSRTYARSEETFDALPGATSHQITIRVRLEEYTGATVATRTLLTHTAKAADISGLDPVLVHMPEKWSGASLSGAIKSAIENTGRVKPVLLIGTEVLMGEPFRQRIKTSGLGSIPGMLSGEGTRKRVALATAEWVEFEFTSPTSGRQIAVRELFDLVGKARRSAGRALTAEEVRAKTDDEKAFDVQTGIYDLLFTTGRIDPDHFPAPAQAPALREGDSIDIKQLLLRSSLTFVSLSDAVLNPLKSAGGAIVRFYPDAPRVVIAELSAWGGVPRTVFDLRHYPSRSVMIGGKTENAFASQIFRGVVNGTLERIVVDLLTSLARERTGALPIMSTSSVFERAQVERVPSVLLPRDSAKLDPSIAEDAAARLRVEVAQGALAVAPQRAVVLGGASRFAWWRIDPASGETTAVTDEGLHSASVERPTTETTVTIETNVAANTTRITVTQPIAGSAATQTVSHVGSIWEMAYEAGVLRIAGTLSGWVVREIFR